MSDKYITDEGISEILKIAFANDGSNKSFSYMALADSTSSASLNGDNDAFSELSRANYSRVPTVVEDSSTPKKITLSAIFDENNYDSSDNTEVGEIGLCNSPTNAENTIFFAYCKVPKLPKNGQISLKYTIIISAQ